MLRNASESISYTSLMYCSPVRLELMALSRLGVASTSGVQSSSLVQKQTCPTHTLQPHSGVTLISGLVPVPSSIKFLQLAMSFCQSVSLFPTRPETNSVAHGCWWLGGTKCLHSHSPLQKRYMVVHR